MMTNKNRNLSFRMESCLYLTFCSIYYHLHFTFRDTVIFYTTWGHKICSKLHGATEKQYFSQKLLSTAPKNRKITKFCFVVAMISVNSQVVACVLHEFLYLHDVIIIIVHILSCLFPVSYHMNMCVYTH